jgi:hypothetical protein
METLAASLALPAKKGAYYLIKLPKDFNIHDLNGQQFSIGDEKAVKMDNKSYVISTTDKSSNEVNFRPVVHQKSSNKAIIGAKFSGSISLRQTIADIFGSPDPIPQVGRNVRLIGLTVRIHILILKDMGGYGNVEQIADLKVRSMPRGSFTDVMTLRSR